MVLRSFSRDMLWVDGQFRELVNGLIGARAQRLCSGGNEPSTGAGHLGCAARALRWSSGNNPLPALPCGRRLFVSGAGIGRCGVASSLAACPARSSGLNSQGLRAGERDVSDDLLPVDEDLSNPPPYAVPLITAYGLAALNWGGSKRSWMTS